MKLNAFLLILTISGVFTQDNAENGVAKLLLDCYNNTAIPGITIANERPPSSINLLVEYIRKLEDANPTLNARELSLQIIQRLRQDGITWADRTVDERFGVPFTSSRLERYKFRVFISRLIPNPETTLDFGELSAPEKCALHYMISNTIDDFRRPNEATECSKSARFTSRIITRREAEPTNSDVESISNINPHGSLAQINSNTSQCPIELGVTYTQFGAIKTGDVLAGIAAGLNQQSVDGVDNRYAGTLVGEIGEASLYQAQEIVSLGAVGGWNSTISPKYLFLQSNNYLQATDAEIRGALDGLYMALRMDSWITSFSYLKISQILDAYYSPYEKGVLNSYMKACNRNILFTEMVPQDTFYNQLLAFIPVLNRAAISGVSLSNNSFPVLARAGINASQLYIPTLTTRDLLCTNNQIITRVSSDLHIFIDTTWSYSTVQLLLTYVLDNIDVNKFGTRYTIYGGNDIETIVNQTYYLSNFHSQYNEAVHNNVTRGFAYDKVIEKVESIANSKLNNASYAGGESTIFLFVTTTSINSNQVTFLQSRKSVINEYLSYISILVAGTGSQSDYGDLVTNVQKDVNIIQQSTSEEQVKLYGQSVVNSIKNVPRSIVNPACGSSYQGSGTFSLTDYVEPQGVNYYKIPTNYFYSSSNLIVREQNGATVSVCISRENSKPDNQTDTCQNISNSGFTVDVSGYCSGTSVSACSPIYISLSGIKSTTTPNCQEASCRFPDDIKVSITLEQGSCTSGSTVYRYSGLILFIICFVNFLR
ncbi:uncharacterized protein LOC143197282 [Rhynchophorus ferrugineus]|uniref:uncharacterized protein LOC143197282 n=1 Tax=Rhynchophorus ferrugineus TaxID=354439 RepID=UPI003FCE1492